MIRGLIFDLDGVIVSTEKNHFLSWKKIASSLGVVFTEKENESLKGINRRDSLNIILELANIRLSEVKINHLLNKKNELYKYSLRNLNKLDILDGVEDLLLEAKNKNILLVEPVPYNYKILYNKFKDNKNISICTKAIFSKNQKKNFYFVKEASISKLGKHWASGIGSFDKQHIINHKSKRFNIQDIDIDSIEVDFITFDNLIQGNQVRINRIRVC